MYLDKLADFSSILLSLRADIDFGGPFRGREKIFNPENFLTKFKDTKVTRFMTIVIKQRKKHLYFRFFTFSRSLITCYDHELF